MNDITNINNFISKDGDYTIYLNEPLGKGAYAIVYKCMYKGKENAAKVMDISKKDEKTITQLKNEMNIINILKRYQHQNILQYYSANLEKIGNSNCIVIIMEYCHGEDLTKKIRKGLDEITVQNYTRQLVNACLHLNGLRIIHRDIKSNNIMITDKGVLKLIDFGLSKSFVDLNRTLCGTPLYMAPEILNRLPYDDKCDLWSIGNVIYEMTYGNTPFYSSEGIGALKLNILVNSIMYSPNNSIGEILSDNCIQFMKKLLIVNPNKRLSWENIKKEAWIKIDIRSTPIPIHSLSNTNTNKSISHLQQCNENDKYKILKDIKERLKHDIRHEPVEDNEIQNGSDCMFDLDEDLSDSQLEDVSQNSSKRNIPIKYNKLPNASRLDMIDFQDIENRKKKRSSTHEKIAEYIYSKSVPIASNLLFGMNKLSKSAGKTFKHLFSPE